MKSKKDYKKRENFLINSEDTGRFIVYSKKTKKTYFIEPQGDPHVEWGRIDQSSGKLNVKKGWKKNKGSIEKEESVITTENGFKNIKTLKAGESPLDYINRIDEEYYKELHN